MRNDGVEYPEKERVDCLKLKPTCSVRPKANNCMLSHKLF